MASSGDATFRSGSIAAVEAPALGFPLSTKLRACPMAGQRPTANCDNLWPMDLRELSIHDQRDQLPHCRLRAGRCS